MLNAESLLLVDYQQPEIFELDVVREQAVGADHAVDFASLDALDDLLGLGCSQESRQHLDPNWVAREPVSERIAVLGREQRGGGQYGDLFAILDRLERGPD